MATAMNITVGPWVREAPQRTPEDLLAEAQALCDEWLAEADEEAQAILARADAQAAAIIDAARALVEPAPPRQNDVDDRVVLPATVLPATFLARVRRLFRRI